MRKAFDHIGIPTTAPQSGESWVPFSQVWVTNPRLHPHRLEFIRPKEFPEIPPAQTALWKLWHWPHVAYRVDDLKAALSGEEVVLGPFDPGGFGQVAFIYKDGLIVEYLEYSDLEHWFGQANPPDFRHVPFVGEA